MAGVEGSSTDCPVCSEEFTEPKLLACNHLVCRKCVLGWLKKSGQHGGCPLCRAPILPASSAFCPFPAGPGELERLVDALPTDLSMVARVESSKILSSGHVCMHCDNHASASCFCLQCNMKLCTACSKGHKRIPSLKNHVIEDLSQLTPQRLVEINRCTCKNHDDRLAELYCSTHQELICLLCSSTNHRACEEVKAIKEAAQEKREEFRLKTQRLKEQEQDMRTEITNVADTFKAMRRKVKDVFDDLEQHVAWRRQEVYALIQTKEDKLAARGLDQQRAAIASHASVMHNLVTSAPDDALLDMAAKMKARLQDLDLQTAKRDKVTAMSDVIFDDPTLTQLKSAIATLGNLVTRPTRTSKATFFGKSKPTSVGAAVAASPATYSPVASLAQTSATPPQASTATSPAPPVDTSWFTFMSQLTGSPVTKPKASTSKPREADLARVLKVGDRVKPGPDWYPRRFSERNVKQGTVTAFPSVKASGPAKSEFADVRWDNGYETCYPMGLNNKYSLDLL